MLEIKDLVFNPTGEKNILNGVNLSIPDGKLIAITGPNGGGKTTLAKTIVGINTPNKGQILFNGKDISALGPTEHANLGISFAFQQPVRFKGIKVRDLLNIAAKKTLSEEELKNVLERVGMDYKAYVDREVDNYLSGGEIKRIEIATVILRDSKLAVFDEPEAGIDLWSFNNLIRVFEDLRDERKCTILVISHQERILSIADEIIMIQNGKVGLSGDNKTMFKKLLCKNDCTDCCSVKEVK